MGSLNRIVLQELAASRLDDAKVLVAGGRHSAAYYLAGYVVECALKACISKRIRQYDFPNKKLANDSYEHLPEKLVKTAELNLELKDRQQRDSEFERYWKIVADWRSEARYEEHSAGTARDMLRAVDDPDHGVFKWLREHW